MLASMNRTEVAVAIQNHDIPEMRGTDFKNGLTMGRGPMPDVLTSR
jgi:hypothetical protein